MALHPYKTGGTDGTWVSVRVLALVIAVLPAWVSADTDVTDTTASYGKWSVPVGFDLIAAALEEPARIDRLVAAVPAVPFEPGERAPSTALDRTALFLQRTAYLTPPARAPPW
ncbi:MAG: hypothetical protein KDB18_05720 [Salinibacterium sp.]|nr:hypothetical protein [Salinibacterium sp.]